MTSHTSALPSPTPVPVAKAIAEAVPSELSKSPLIGILGVVLGAGIVTLTGRMLTLGTADLKGDVGIGFDDGAWIGSAFNIALMFIGPFTVYLGGLLGARRVLITAASLFTLICALLPFVHSYSLLLIGLALAGLTSGTFYPLTLTFALRNIPLRFLPFTLALYATFVDTAVNIAPSLYGWYRDHLSFQWMFWNSAVLTPLMVACIYYGIPAAPPAQRKGPPPSFAGFLYASAGFALLFAALDQGQRLDWWRSGLFNALISAATIFLLGTLVRRLRMPNSLVDLPYLWLWNTQVPSGGLGMRCGLVANRTPSEISTELQTTRLSGRRSDSIPRGQIMKMRASLFVFAVLILCPLSGAQESKSPSPRHLTLDEAVQLALKHNHVVRIANYKVEEKQQVRGIAKSAYYPVLRNDSNYLRLTDTQFIGISSGSLGVIGGAPLPAQSVILNQGGRSLISSGTSLTQPLTELWRVKPANDIATADWKATRGKAHQTENEVALRVHQLYYRVLIAQAHREAVLARVKASEDLQNERVAQVKFGSALEEEAIDSRAQSLEAKQDLLATELQLSDLTMQLDDAIGLPLTTQLTLEANVRQVGEICEREECLKAALDSHPEIVEARAEVEKASAAVRLAKREYIPDVEAFARYSYQDNVPFLARNFGTFGVHLGIDLFDGGRRSAAIGEHKAQLSQAEENLARVKEEVELRVQTAFNKLERTRQMVKVSDELLTLRAELRRVSAQQLQEGSALRSQADSAAARELEAKTLLLQSQLDYIQARDEMMEAMGQTPE